MAGPPITLGNADAHPRRRVRRRSRCGRRCSRDTPARGVGARRPTAGADVLEPRDRAWRIAMQTLGGRGRRADRGGGHRRRQRPRPSAHAAARPPRHRLPRRAARGPASTPTTSTWSSTPICTPTTSAGTPTRRRRVGADVPQRALPDARGRLPVLLRPDGPAGPTSAAWRIVFRDSVFPVADQMELWSDDLQLSESLRLRPAPGHTPGSSVLWLDAGRPAVFVGDLTHCPIQIARPDGPVRVRRRRGRRGGDAQADLHRGLPRPRCGDPRALPGPRRCDAGGARRPVRGRRLAGAAIDLSTRRT